MFFVRPAILWKRFTGKQPPTWAAGWDSLACNLIYGGASIGLMGCVARGVHEFGGQVTGVLPEFFKIKEIEYGDADELIVTKDMRERKAVMDQKSDAFITLPGGIGTMEEAMEILSMKQLKLTPSRWCSSTPAIFMRD